jgi:molybdopterin-binding protein
MSGGKEIAIELSARNQLKGRVTKVTLGSVMAEVHVQVGANELVSAITRGSVEHGGAFRLYGAGSIAAAIEARRTRRPARAPVPPKSILP